MAQLMHLDCKKVLIFSILLFFFVSVCFSACSQHQVQTKEGLSSRIGSRRLLEEQDDDWEEKPLKKKSTTQSQSQSQSKENQTKLTKPATTSSKNVKSDSISSTTKNQTKTIKSNSLSTKNNQTKTLKSSSNISAKNQTKTKTKTIKSENLSSKSSSSSKTASTDTTGLKKLNSTSSTSNKSNKQLNSPTTPSSTSKFKKLNSTSTSKPTSPSTSNKKPLDLAKATNKTTKSTGTKDKNKQTKTTTSQASDSDQTKPIIKKPEKASPPTKKPTKQPPPTTYWMDEDDEDFVSEFRDLPNKFHQTLLPDLERISTTSKLYLTKANSEITKGFKPYVGKKYASTVATALSCAFVLIPLILVSLLCTQIKAYFSLQKIIIFIQVYLSIYFTILCVSSLVTGLEPLKFLYSTSQSTYLCLQVLQTLGYVFYLLMLLMYLVLVFSTECGLGSKFLGLAQTLVGIAIGLHYYVTVFHRVVLRQPPKTNWKVHGIYATCFLLICVLSRADRRKKVYVEDGGGEGKQN
ncbi:hypothetical protein HN51_038030 [Arachis hypogaea]|uniref:uncharacterized protein n=1 Tax=Arachis hypogaea TaxID=3818 RepID=UPI000DED3606|nr:uncharacterized protein LOC112792220 [Arachis hypogaea]QHO03679.1 uncharacterized protein DS421_13g434180 [Arachis hypogaea]